MSGQKINTIFFGEYIKEKERVVRQAIQRSAQGVTKGGLLTHPEVMAGYEEWERKKNAAVAEKVEKVAVRATARAEKEDVKQQ